MVFTRKYILQLAVGKDENSGGTPEPKKVTINGKEMLFSDLQQAALQDAHRWALYLNLSADLEKAFNYALSTVLEGISNGTKYENGRYYGNHGNNLEYYGKFSGEKKDGKRAWNGLKRNGYDAFGNVVAYLNGKTGSIKSSAESKPEKAPVTSTKKKWSNNSIDNHVYRNLFGLMPISELDLTKWADNALDTFSETDAVRGTGNRRRLLTLALADLDLDKYDLNDEDKALYSSWLLNKDADGLIDENALRKLGLGTFLFTTDKYGVAPMTDKEKLALEEKRKQEELALEEKRKQEELKAKKEKYNQLFLNWLNLSYSDDLNYNLLWDNNLNAEGLETIDNIIANGYDWDNFLSNLNNDLTSNYSGLNMDSYWRSRNLYDSSSPESWNYDMMLHQGIFGAAYINAFNPNMYAGAIGARLGSPDINPLLYRLMAYNNFLALSYKAGELDDYKVGPNQYMILDSMDKDGNVLIYNYSTSTPSVTRTNIRKFKDRTDLSELFKKIKEKYIQLNGITLELPTNNYTLFDKKGGVLKAQLGSKLSAQYLQLQAEELAALDAMSPAERSKLKQDNRELRKGLTATDYLRLGSLAADLTSAAAAWAPGYGTIVSAATGVTGTVASLAADLKEGNSDALTNLGTGLAMDAVGLIPGLGSAGKVGKITKTLVKWAPRLITMASAANMAPEFISTLQKVTDSKAKLTAKDLRVLSRGVAALAGVSRMGAASYNKRLIDNLARTGKSVVTIMDKDGKPKQISVTNKQAAQLSRAKSEDEAATVLSGFNHPDVKQGDYAAVLNGKEFSWKSPTSWFSKTKNGTNALEEFDYSRVIENPQAEWRWVNGLALFYSRFGVNPRTNKDMYLASRNFSWGWTPQSNRFSVRSPQSNRFSVRSPQSNRFSVRSPLEGRNIGELRLIALAEGIVRSKGITVLNRKNFAEFLRQLRQTGLSDLEITSRLGNTLFVNASKAQFQFKTGGSIPKFLNPTQSIIPLTLQVPVVPVAPVLPVVPLTPKLDPKLELPIKINQTRVGNNPTGAIDYRLGDSAGDAPKLGKDWLPTALSYGKYRMISGINKKIDDIKLDPVMKMFPEAKWRHRGLWDLLNSSNRNAAAIQHVGNMTAQGVSDLGVGTAARLNSAYKAANIISDATAKYNESVIKSEAQAVATGNLNNAVRVDVANGNNAAVVGTNNLDKLKHMQYLNKYAANKSNLYDSMLLGHLLGADWRYRNAYNKYLQSLPEWENYNTLLLEISDILAVDPAFDWTKASDRWGLDKVDAFSKAYSAITAAGNRWTQRNDPLPSYPWAWLKSGGKLEAAERERSRRAASKLFFEHVKHTNMMSHRAIKDSGKMSMYLLKRMMQGN